MSRIVAFSRDLEDDLDWRDRRDLFDSGRIGLAQRGTGCHETSFEWIA